MTGVKDIRYHLGLATGDCNAKMADWLFEEFGQQGHRRFRAGQFRLLAEREAKAAWSWWPTGLCHATKRPSNSGGLFFSRSDGIARSPSEMSPDFAIRRNRTLFYDAVDYKSTASPAILTWSVNHA